MCRHLAVELCWHIVERLRPMEKSRESSNQGQRDPKRSLWDEELPFPLPGTGTLMPPRILSSKKPLDRHFVNRRMP